MTSFVERVADALGVGGPKPEMGHGAPVPVLAAAQLGDLVVGLFAATGAIFSGGVNEDLNRAAHVHLETGCRIAAVTFLNLAKSVNPDASANVSRYPSFAQRITWLFGTARGKLNLLENPTAQHVVLRLLALVEGLVKVMARLVDGVVGALALAPAILVGGQSEALNTWAAHGLSLPMIVADVAHAIRHAINPFSEI